METEMKRDMDLIRKQLLALESGRDPLKIEGYSESALLYHVYLLDDAGFVHAAMARGGQGEVVAAHVMEITWAGQEFLQSIKDDTLWNKAKDKVLKPSASWTFAVLMEWLKQEIKAKVGIP